MPELVSYNGSLLPADAAALSPLSAAALYGKGVFTTLAVESGRPLFWDKHWRRLVADSVKLGIALGDFDETAVCQSLDDVISQRRLTSGRARITFFDTSSAARWPGSSPQPTSLLIVCAANRPTRADFKLTISPYKINSASPLAGVKSCNYLENMTAFEEAALRGFDEAVRLNERGLVTSGCLANIFWISGGRLFTPTPATGCLAGTTREFIIENLKCRETAAAPDEIDKAEAIFLTSAGLGVREVTLFGARQMKRSDHPITKLHFAELPPTKP